MDKLGFIGFGAMAQRMAARLTAAGYDVVANDRSHDGGTVHGTRMIATAAELAGAVDVVLVSVPADEALEAVADGPHNLFEGLRRGGLLIDLSSVSPQASRALDQRGRTAGVRVIDAPVSGSTPEAEKGELVVLVGGDDADVEAARPILEVIGKKVVHVGPAGTGSTMKLVINGVMGAAMAALAEAIALGLGAGLDRTLLFETLSGLAVVSPHHVRKLEAAADGDFAPQFPTRLMLKDMRLALDDAARLGVMVPTLAAATQLFAQSSRRHDDDDYSAVVETAERLAPHA